MGETSTATYEFRDVAGFVLGNVSVPAVDDDFVFVGSFFSSELQATKDTIKREPQRSEEIIFIISV
jgi:hypothetical protein